MKDILKQLKRNIKCLFKLCMCSGYKCYPDNTICYGCNDCKNK